jgi:membrane protease YdiL (CAAX protease family)
MIASLAPWVKIAIVNTLIAGVVLWRCKVPPRASSSDVRMRLAAWGIPALVLLGTLLLIVFASSAARDCSYEWWEAIGLIIWVPVVEEIIFRRALLTWLGQRLPGFWSLYLSALLFAMSHPTTPWYIPALGPFLLGMVAGWSYQVTQRLLSPILLHSVCNGSAILFACYSPSWLDRLSWLYQRL